MPSAYFPVQCTVTPSARLTADDDVLLLRSPLVQQVSTHALNDQQLNYGRRYTDGDAVPSIFFAKSAEISVVGLQVRFSVHIEM